jgi:hypothetical protein
MRITDESRMAWKFQSVPLLAVTKSFYFTYRHYMGAEARI